MKNIDVARTFLQTVLMYDDQAYRAPLPEEMPAVLDDDVPFADGEDVPVEAVGLVPSAVDLPAESEDFAVLDVVSSFAAQDMACTVLAPSDGGPAADTERFLQLARRADVVIVDWLIRQQRADVAPGLERPAIAHRTSMELIKAVLDQDRAVGSRLRLVCVYSGSREPDKLRGEVVDALRGQGLSVSSGAGTGRVDVGDARIVFLSKEQLSGPSLDDEVPPSALAERIVTEFASFAADGLLPSLGLSTVSAVRDQVHRLLQRFNSTLDPALLSHRALTSAAATQEFMVELLSDELGAIVANSDVMEQLGDGQVQQHVESAVPLGTTRTFWQSGSGDAKPVSVTAEAARRVLTHGVELNDRGKLQFQSEGNTVKVQDLASLTPLGMAAPEGSLRARSVQVDLKFALLSSLSRDGTADGEKTRPPELRLGSLLRRIDPAPEHEGGSQGAAFYVCLQPICDSTRLSPTEPSSFPFAPLTAGTEDKFGLVVRDPDLQRVVPRLRLSAVQIFAFRADPSTTTVTGTWNPTHERWAFHGEDGDFDWIGDIRLDKAHRMISALASNAARIGTNEYEYLRQRQPD